MKRQNIGIIIAVVAVVAIVVLVVRKDKARAREDQLPDELPEGWPFTDDPSGEFEEYWQTIWPTDWPF